jgi:hypothetical protein
MKVSGYGAVRRNSIFALTGCYKNWRTRTSTTYLRGCLPGRDVGPTRPTHPLGHRCIGQRRGRSCGVGCRNRGVSQRAVHLEEWNSGDTATWTKGLTVLEQPLRPGYRIVSRRHKPLRPWHPSHGCSLVVLRSPIVPMLAPVLAPFHVGWSLLKWTSGPFCRTGVNYSLYA